MSTQTQAPADLTAQVAALQARLTAARRERARADLELDAANAAAAAAREALEREFGVTTGAQARQLLTQMETELAAAVTELDTQLNAMEQR